MLTPRRVYIKLLAEFLPTGQIRPLQITLPDYRTYSIQRVVLTEHQTRYHIGVTCYEVVVRNQVRPIYHEDQTGKWFVELVEKDT